LPIYEVPESLGSHHTTKKKIANGEEVLPPKKYLVQSQLCVREIEDDFVEIDQIMDDS